MKYGCLLLSLWLGLAQANVKHVEPLSWWVGMQDPTLQLMLHGDDIADHSVTVDYPGVTLKSVTKTDNPNYLFLNLVIDPDTSPGEVAIWVGEQQLDFALAARRAGSSSRKGFGPADTVYLITPDRFVNGDKGNDEVATLKEGLKPDYPGGRHGGDIQGIINRLDYLDELGVTQLWLMPVLQNDQPGYSYHGYSTTHHYKIDARYGSNALYQTLSEHLARRGMGLIKDIILNHIGSEHWWMKDLPASDWINYQGEFVGTSHRRETMHDPYAVPEDAKRFKDGWFVPTMPDLNQRNPLLATYLIQHSIWWIEYANLSGIRLDTYSYPDSQFLSDYTRRIMQEYPNFNLVGEEWTTDPALVAYWQKDSVRYDDYQSDLPSLMDFPLQAAVINGLKGTESWFGGISNIYKSLASDFLYGHPENLVVFADNHDMSRIFTQLDENVALTKMAMAFYATVRGTLQLYYGTEILMANPGTDDHGIIRSDFPGGFDDKSVNGFSGQGLTAEQAEMQRWMRKLLNWRKQSEAITQGKFLHYAPENGVYVFVRYTDSDRVLIIVNKGEAKMLPLDRYQLALDGAKQGLDVLKGQSVSLVDELSLDAWRTTIIQL